MKVSKLVELSNQHRAAEEYAKNPECSRDARLYAIERIFVKTILFDIIENASEDFIREACLKKFYDYDYFFRLACSDAGWRDRLIALSTLMRDVGLFKSRDEILGNDIYGSYPESDDLPDIAQNDGDWKNRLVATLMIDDDPILSTISLTDESKYVRAAAIFRIDDEEKLVEIIEEDSDYDVVDIACKILDDEDKLKQINRHCRKPAIIGNIHDQFFLIDEVYGSDDWGFCLEASRNIYDPEVLCDMIVGERFQSKFRPPQRFISFPEDYVYFEDLMEWVFYFINDDEIQSQIATMNRDYVCDAIRHIGNPEIYAEFLNSFDYWYFPHDLKGKLIDDETLLNMALNHPSEDVRYHSVSRIFDESQLRRIIDNEHDEKVRNQALWNLNLDESEFTLKSDNRFVCAQVARAIEDEASLVRIICYLHDEYVSQVALNNITDEELLADFVCERPLGISKLAINRISDERLLAKIAVNALDEFDAAYAVTKINDDSLLLEVLKNSPYPRCYPPCILRIEDERILEDIAYNAGDDYLRKIAVSRIQSEDILNHLASNDSNEHVRRQASKNISLNLFSKD